MLKTILTKLNIPENSFSDKSIWPHSPVYRGVINGQEVILKKGKRGGMEKAKSLVKFQNDLNANAGVKVVAPVEIGTENPLLVEKETWVIYPFIKGDDFDNSDDHLEKAGEFLGKMHKYNNEKDYGLANFKPGDFDEEFLEEVAGDLESIHEYLSSKELDKNEQLFNGIQSYIESFHFELMKVDFPLVNATWDYKASNIKFLEGECIGIDLENSGRIPRIIDLALALLLFNGDLEHDKSPSRVFTTTEWESFLRGYKRHISLTEKELDLWDKVLHFVFIDEVLWTVADSLGELEKVSPRRLNFIHNILSIDFTNYRL